MIQNENRLLRSTEGKGCRGRRITVSSFFDCTSDVFWTKLLEISTLVKICNPMLSFKSREKTGQYWQEGELYKFKIRLFRLLPLGIHSILVKNLNHEQKSIQTEERNAFTTIWRHHVSLSQTNGKTLYTDSIELYSGIFSLITAFWSIQFYKHRHRRWKQLLKEEMS